MAMQMIYRPVYGTSNPASVDVRTGVITVNTLVWDMYSDLERRAIIAHEKWHYLTRHTANEIACDEYAFKQVAGTEANSLMQYLDLIRSLAKHDDKRYIEAQKRVLLYAADNGSDYARQLIKLFL